MMQPFGWRDIVAQGKPLGGIVCFPNRWLCLVRVLQRAGGLVVHSLGLMAAEPACKVIPKELIRVCPASPQRRTQQACGLFVSLR